MPHHARDRRNDSKDLWRDPFRPRTCSDQDRHLYRSKTLQKIRSENGIAIVLAQCSYDIGSTNVAAATVSYVNSCNSTRDIAERNRTQKIAPDHYSGEGEHGEYYLELAATSTDVVEYKLFLHNQIDIIAISAGVIPLIRAACPSELGRVNASFCLVSERRPGISS